MDSLWNFISTPSFLLVLWGLSFTVVLIFLPYAFSNYHYGYRSGKRVLKRFGGKIWEDLKNKNQSCQFRELIDKFRDEIVHWAVSNRKKYLNSKIEKLKEEKELLLMEKREHEASISSMDAYLKNMGLEFNRGTEFIIAAMENNAVNIHSRVMGNVNFDKEYAARKVEIKVICEEIDNNVEVLEGNIHSLHEESNKLIESPTPIFYRAKERFLENAKNLKMTIIILILFLVEFFITKLALEEVYQAKAIQANGIKKLIFEIIPYLGGMVIPIALIGLYAWIFSNRKKKGIFNKILLYVLIAGNIVALTFGLYFFVIINTGTNISDYVDWMWRALLFPIVLLTTLLLEQEKDEKATIVHHYNFIFVIPEMLVDGLLVVTTSIANLISNLETRLRYFLKIHAEKRSENRLRRQKERYQKDLELFYMEYIEGLAEKLREKITYKDVLDEIRKSETNFINNVSSRVKEIILVLKSKLPSLKKKLRKKDQKIEKLESTKNDIIEGVHTSIKKTKYLEQIIN